jgi:AraC-like DNA-binding protein
MRFIRENSRWRILRSNRQEEECLEILAFVEGYRVGSVCDRLGVSEAYFREVFVRDLGLSPKEWMRWERMVVARRLLECERQPCEVAALLGFADMNSFRREFTQAYGVSAQCYLRQRARLKHWPE